MSVVKGVSGMLGAVLIIAMAGNAVAKTKSGITLRDREQAACYNDAQSLCGEFVPDEQKITACMTAKIDKVSAGCRKFFHTGKK